MVKVTFYENPLLSYHPLPKALQITEARPPFVYYVEMSPGTGHMLIIRFSTGRVLISPDEGRLGAEELLQDRFYVIMTTPLVAFPFST